MSYDFVVDAAKLSELAESLQGYEESTVNAQNDINVFINNMPATDQWSGSTYDLFKSKTDEYKEEFDDMYEYIDKYVETLGTIVEAAGTLDQAIIDACAVGGE